MIKPRPPQRHQFEMKSNTQKIELEIYLNWELFMARVCFFFCFLSLFLRFAKVEQQKPQKKQKERANNAQWIESTRSETKKYDWKGEMQYVSKQSIRMNHYHETTLSDIFSHHNFW